MGKFNKGLNRDTDPLDQPEGSWRYAKNIIIEPNSGAIQFERGTQFEETIKGEFDPLTQTATPFPNGTGGYKVVGNIVLQDDKVVLFSVFSSHNGGNAYWTSPGVSEIGIFDNVTSIYTPIYNDYAQIFPAAGIMPGAPLNFRKEYPIQGEFKIDATGQTSIYWTDDNEVMRFMRLYNPPVTGITFDMETINIFPLLSTSPYPNFKSIVSGVLGTGVYALMVALVNDEGTPTNYLNISNWVKITDDAESAASTSTEQISYATPGFATGTLIQLGPTSYTGAPADFATGKGVVWTVSNLDPRYSFIRPAIIYKIGGVTECVILQDIDYDVTASTSMDISYTGNETARAEVLSNILIAAESYVQAKTVAQVDDVLYWGNLVKSNIDINYQPYANNIKIEAVFANQSFSSSGTVMTNGVPVTVDFTPSIGGEQRSAESQYYRKGYQRDETYAFYITWILADGNETVAYHIPGRAPLSMATYAGPNTTETTLAGSPLVTFKIPINDCGIPTPLAGASNPLQPPPQYSYFGAQDVPLYKVTTFGATLVNSNGMGYWENSTEKYPNNSNYDVLNADGTSGGPSLQGQRVRHHHFPAALSEENGAPGDGGHIWAKAGNGSFNQEIVFNPLGFRAKNVPLPKFMEGKVLGYKLYYSYRDEANSTVIDTGIFNATPSHHGPPGCGRWGAGPGSGGVGWGDSSSCWAPTLDHPKNGYGAAGFTSNCHPTWVSYAVQPPPGGLDYTGTGWLQGNSSTWTLGIPVGFMRNDDATGGAVVCTPFSAMHAPYSNVGFDKWAGRGYSHIAAYINDPTQANSGFNGLNMSAISPGPNGTNNNRPGCCDLNDAYTPRLDICYNTDRRLSDSPSANHFTFNGLHTHINAPDTSNASFVKLQRHMQIGRYDSGTGQMLGSSFIRLDNTGVQISERSKHCVFFNWTIMAPLDYSTPKVPQVAGDFNNYNVPYVQSAAIALSGPAAPPGGYRQNLRAIVSNTFKKIPADTNMVVQGSSAGNVQNAGGCQTFYFQTHNNLIPHSYTMWMNFYMAYAHYKEFHSSGGNHVNDWGTNNMNYISYHRGDHHWLFNKFDTVGYGWGTWGFTEGAIGHASWNGATNSHKRNWQDGWTTTFKYSKFWCRAHTGTGAAASYAFPFPGTVSYDADAWGEDTFNYAAYGSVHREINDLYNTFDTQSNLVYTGYMKEVTSLFPLPAAGTTLNSPDVIFGGDTYIDLYCETRHMKGKGQDMSTLNGPNYCPSGNSTVSEGCCETSLITACGIDDCENIDFAGIGADESQGYLYNAARYSHYAYGIMGDMHGEMSTDITQQLYVTESKINITERYTGGLVNEDYYPAVHRQKDTIVNYNAGPRIFSYDQTMGSLMNLYPTVVFNYLNKTSNRVDFPTRIIRSVKYNQSGLIDNFRSYKPSQYRDLPRNRGELWNISVYDNVLIAQLERAMMKTKGKESLQTGGGLGDVSEIALGDGDLFAQDPNEVLYTQRGYAGTLSQWSVCVSLYGHLSIDKKEGKVFLMSDKIEEISGYGMRSFFSKRLTTWGLQNFGLPTNIDLPTLNIGVIATYDPQYTRFIITKLDKVPTQVFKTGFDLGIATPNSVNSIYWDPVHRAYYKITSVLPTIVKTYLNFEDSYYFKEASWTVSYYPALKCWASIHDFTPRMYFYTTNNLYSLTSSLTTVHQHNYATGTTSGGVAWNIATYYDHAHDVEFEYIDNVEPLDNKLFYSINYTVDVELPANQDSGARHNYHETGFTHFFVYNSRQVSSEIPLIGPEGQNNNLWSTATARRKERTWYAKGFRDDRLQAPLTPNSALDAPIDTPILNSDYQTADIPINLLGISSTKLWNDRRKMVDKWMAIRLIAKQNYSVITAPGVQSSQLKLVTLHESSATKRKTSR